MGWRLAPGRTHSQTEPLGKEGFQGGACHFFAVGRLTMVLAEPTQRISQRPLELCLMKKGPTSQDGTILLDIFIHLTETFTYQISLKCNLQNLEANM